MLQQSRVCCTDGGGSTSNSDHTITDKTKIDDNGVVSETETIESWKSSSNSMSVTIDGSGSFKSKDSSGDVDMSGTFELDGSFSNSSGNTEHTKKVDGTLVERDYTRTNSSSNSMRVDVEASGDDWDFELHTNSSNGHNRTVVGTLTTETATGSRRSSSSSGWVLTIYHSWGTTTISSSSSTSTNTGGSVAALADGTFGTYFLERDIGANGNGTSSWSGTQAKRIESSSEWIDTGPDDRTTSDTITTLDINDTDTYEETEHHGTSRTNGVDNDPYDFTTQNTYPTSTETQRETAEDTPNPHNASGHLTGGMMTANGVVTANTNYNGDGFGNAGTGSGSVQASGSASYEPYHDTGSLPDGGYWEHYDDGNYWYYAEYDSGNNQTFYEDGYHETGSINMPLSAGQNAATGAEETVEDGDEVRVQYAIPPQPKSNPHEIAEAIVNPNNPPEEIRTDNWWNDELVYWHAPDGKIYAYYDDPGEPLVLIGEVVPGKNGKNYVRRFVQGKGYRYLTLDDVETEVNSWSSAGTQEQWDEIFWQGITPYANRGFDLWRAAVGGTNNAATSSALRVLSTLFGVAEGVDQFATALVDEAVMSLIPWGKGVKIVAKAGTLLVKATVKVGGKVTQVTISFTKDQVKRIGKVLGLADDSADNVAKELARLEKEAAEGSAEAALKLKNIGTSYFDDIAELGIDETEGFLKYADFKKIYGEAGDGKAWHHIVEQTPNKGNFPARAIHNPKNIIPLPHGKGSIHSKLSGYYSSKPAWTGGLTVRQWISQKSFKEQYEFGIKIIKQFGGARYLPRHLR